MNSILNQVRRKSLWVSLALFSVASAHATVVTRFQSTITSGTAKVGSSSAASASAALEVQSTTKGFLGPRMTTAERDLISSPATGLEIYNTSTNKKNVYTGSVWSEVGGGGGGGGGSLLWTEDTDSPTPATEYNNQVFSFDSGLSQNLYALVRVPTSYAAGSQVSLKLSVYSADSSGTALITCQSTLIRSGTDAMNSTTNQRTATNSAITLSGGTVSIPQAVACDLTSASGQINSVSISAGDLIKVRLYRGTDTATSAVKVPVYGAEVIFQ